MKKYLSLLLLFTMLIIMPVSVSADDLNQEIDLSEEFNYDVFIHKKTLGYTTSSGSYIDFMYDKDNITTPLVINEVSYNLMNLDAQVADSYNVVDSDFVVTLDSADQKAMKKIGFIAGTMNETASVNVEITFENDSTLKTTQPIAVLPVTTSSQYSEEGGNALILKNETSSKWYVKESEEPLYLNAYEFSFSSPLKVKSIKFEKDDGKPYFISALTGINYTSEELEDMVTGEIDNKLSLYVNLTPEDIDADDDGDVEDDLSDLDSLYLALLAADPNEVEAATAENIEKIYNLKEGYRLIAEKAEIKSQIGVILDEKNYLDENIDYTLFNEDDENNIIALIEKYERAIEMDDVLVMGDNKTLSAILSYWSLSDNSEFDLTGLETLKELKSNYENNKIMIEFNNEIVSLYSSYSSDTLDSLLADESKYEALKAFFESEAYFDTDSCEEKYKVLDSNTEKYEKLKYLYLNFLPYKNSEAAHMIDLNKYFNKNIAAEVGERYSENEFGMKNRIDNDASKNKFSGVRRSAIVSKLDSDGILSRNSLLSMSVQNVGNKLAGNDFLTSYSVEETPFDLSNFKTPGKNNIIYTDAANKSLTIDGVFSDKSSKFLLVLLAIGIDYQSVNFEIEYVNGNVQTQKLTTPWSEQHLVSVEGYENVDGATVKYPGISPAAGTQKKQYYLNDEGIITESTEIMNNSLLFIPFAIKLDDYAIKSIKYTTLEPARMYNPIVAMTEIPLKNSDFIALASAAWNDGVKDYNEENVTPENAPKIKEVLFRYNECEKRGIDPESIFGEAGVEKINKMAEKILFVENNETSRTDEKTIKSVIKFSTSVTKQNISDYINVGDGTDDVEFSCNLLSDNKTLEIFIPTTRNGGSIYTIKISSGLSVADYPVMTLGKDFIYSYKTSDCVIYNYTAKTVKNNSDGELVDALVTANAIKTTDNGIIVYDAEKESVTIPANDSATVSLELSNLPEGSTVNNSVYDTNLKLLSSDVLIPKCEKVENKAADYNDPILSLDTGMLKLEGYTKSHLEDKIVSLLITDEVGNLKYAGSIKTGKNGYFSFDVILPSEVYTNSFEMSFKLGGDDFTVPHDINTKIYYSSENEKQTIIGNIISATDENDIINNVGIDNIKKVLALNFSASNIISDSGFAKTIFALKNELSLSDYGKTQTALKQASILAAFNENKKNTVYVNGVFSYDDIMGYTNTIQKNGATLYEVFKENISSEGQDKIVNSLLGKNYTSLSTLMSDLATGIFVNALNYPVTNGVGYVEKVLTSANAATAGVTITNYRNTMEFNNAIAQKAGTFTDKTSVEQFIANFVISPPPTVSFPSASSSSSTGGFGVSGNPADVQIKEPSVAPNDAPLENSTIFSDVPKSHWAYENILSLYNKNIIAGKGESIFDPESSITRGELSKMLCKAFNLVGNDKEVPFEDLNGKWYNEYAEILYQNNIINGMKENEFGGESYVSRQDLCTMLYRLKNVETNYQLTFSDKHTISDYAKNAVQYLCEKEIINGFSDNTFRADEFCSRAQVSKILDLFINLD